MTSFPIGWFQHGWVGGTWRPISLECRLWSQKYMGTTLGTDCFSSCWSQLKNNYMRRWGQLIYQYNPLAFQSVKDLNATVSVSVEPSCIYWSQTCPTSCQEHLFLLRLYNWISAFWPCRCTNIRVTVREGEVDHLRKWYVKRHELRSPFQPIH